MPKRKGTVQVPRGGLLSQLPSLPSYEQVYIRSIP